MTDYEDEILEGSDLVKDLRKQIKDRDKAYKELETKFDTAFKSLNEVKLRDVLGARGITDARAAKWLQKDVEDLSDESAVNAWLEQNGTLFGAPAQEKPSAEHQQLANDFQVMQQTERTGETSTAENEWLATVKATKTPEELDALLVARFGQDAQLKM